ncbi:hypothetical protein FBZ83_11710 [Azospirillum brasilense]|uniref:DUF2513 domain-containing protein n=1 Tax=Azospirillum brasilense TaxID=192 RepID=A0A560BWH7_AZOBR|nr:hypothetical protein [Azospirillum brasilense]TWA76869.1 hypothetical protein FBZ83_11710 [Azospirillum brasilense]
MPKPQYSSRLMVQGYLTQDQIMLLLTADPGTGEVYTQSADAPCAAPEWLVVECHDRGLITPGDGPGRWRLSPDGWDAWNALLD